MDRSRSYGKTVVSTARASNRQSRRHSACVKYPSYATADASLNGHYNSSKEGMRDMRITEGLPSSGREAPPSDAESGGVNVSILNLTYPR